MNTTTKEQTPPSSSLPSSSSSWLQSSKLVHPYLITIGTLICVPFYSMALCILFYTSLIIFCPTTTPTTLLLQSILLLYVPHCLLDKTPSRGGWDADTTFTPLGIPLHYIFPSLKHWNYRSQARNNILFQCVAKYFDMQLIKTSELNPNDRNYMFIYHPHGVIGMGANTALNTNGCDFETLYPGIHRSSVTLNICFTVPIFREWMLMNGFISADKTTLLKQLTTSQPFRKSIVLVPGGAKEAMHAHPGVFRLYLKNRKGFIKVALESGCSVVPCLGFGENEIFGTIYDKEDHKRDVRNYDNGDGDGESSTTMSKVKRRISQWQTKFMNITTFFPILLTHITPNKCKVAVVVGDALDCDEEFKKSLATTTSSTTGTESNSRNITQEMVDQCHAIYIEKVRKLYDEYKEQYGMDGVELEIL